MATDIEDSPPLTSHTRADGVVTFHDLWWQTLIPNSIGISPETLPVDVASLTQTALVYSPYVQAVLTEPQIKRSDLVVADAEFDALAFVEAKFADTNEPVGSLLTTGDASERYLDNTFSSAAGLRKKSRLGGALEAVQRGGFQDNNSTFLIPNPQGTTRLEINFTQPLLKDHGRAVNNTRVLLAQIDVELAKSEVRADLEDHLVDVTRAYWDLFESRAEWLQRNRLLDGATELHRVLVARGGVDSLKRQILRAQVAVTSRRSDLIRAETRIKNSQARLRYLTGDPRLIQTTRWEMTPQDQPLAVSVRVSAREATLTALDNRPDIAQALRRIQAVSARIGAAKNQVLPRLDMILSTYVAGLEDKTDTFGAFVNQFSDGRPSYAAGLLYEAPFGNRASRARLQRSRWELVRAMNEFQQTTDLAFTEVEVAVRETKASLDETIAKKQAIDAASQEVSYLQERWELLPDPNESAVLLIENLLDAQERLADAEREFVRAQVTYAMSWVQLRRAMGVLLQIDSYAEDCYISSEKEALKR
ncbi:MAG: TolC family protein [Rubripirellula sp.]